MIISAAVPARATTTIPAPVQEPATPTPAPDTTAPDTVGGLEVDTTLVDGLRLPRIPGLPGADTPGLSLGELKKLLGPPAPGSALDKADMAAVRGAQLLRTDAGDAWAARMDKDGVTKIWFDLAKRYRAETGKVQGWLGTALLASTLATNGAVTGIGKQVWKRPRPFTQDSSITVPFKKPHANTSYPSGHASSAFAAARVISVLEPKLAAEAYSLATQVAASRVYGGVHFPSDVVAGALLGTAVAEAALRNVGKR